MKFILSFIFMSFSIIASASEPLFIQAVSMEHLRSVSRIHEANHANLELWKNCVEFLITGNNSFAEDQEDLIMQFRSIRDENFNEILNIGCDAAVNQTLIPEIYLNIYEMKINLALGTLGTNPSNNRGGHLIDHQAHKRIPRSLEHHWISVPGLNSHSWGKITDLSELEYQEADKRLVQFRTNQCIDKLDSLPRGTFSARWHRTINTALGRSENLTNREICTRILLVYEVEEELKPLVRNGYTPAFAYRPVSDARAIMASHLQKPGVFQKLKNYFKENYLLTINTLSVLAIIDTDQVNLQSLKNAFNILVSNSTSILEDYKEDIEELELDLIPEVADRGDYWNEVIDERMKLGRRPMRSYGGRRLQGIVDTILDKYKNKFKWQNARELTNLEILRHVSNKEQFQKALDVYWQMIDRDIQDRDNLHMAVMIVGSCAYVAACITFSGGMATLACGVSAGLFITGAFVIQAYQKNQKILKHFLSGVSPYSREYSARDLSLASGHLRMNVYMGVAFAGFIALGKSVGAINRQLALSGVESADQAIEFQRISERNHRIMMEAIQN